MASFSMNGYVWRICFVYPKSHYLMDRTGNLRVATTDPETRIIFLSNDLSGSFLEKVLIHEIGHCALFSFHLVDDIHRMVRPEYWIEAEEWICNFIADYGQIIYSTVYSYLGVHAWKAIPYELERLIA